MSHHIHLESRAADGQLTHEELADAPLPHDAVDGADLAEDETRAVRDGYLHVLRRRLLLQRIDDVLLDDGRQDKYRSRRNQREDENGRDCLPHDEPSLGELHTT